MFVITLSYIVPLEQVEPWLAEHIQFLDAQYEAGIFIASGRRVPRTGGVILARNCDRDTIEKIMELDPFKREQLAEFTIIEFTPSKMTAGFEQFI